MFYQFGQNPINKNDVQKALIGFVDQQISSIKAFELTFCCLFTGTKYLIHFCKDSEMHNFLLEFKRDSNELNLEFVPQVLDRKADGQKNGPIYNRMNNRINCPINGGMNNQVDGPLDGQMEIVQTELFKNQSLSKFKSKSLLILIDYQFEASKMLLQVKKYLYKTIKDLPLNEIQINNSFILKKETNRIDFKPQSKHENGISLKCYVYKKSRVKTTGYYFLLFCEMNHSGKDWRFLIMVKGQGDASLESKTNIHFLLETTELDIEYCFERLHCTKIKISPDQKDFTRCFLFTIGKSTIKDAEVFNIDQEELYDHNNTLLSTFSNYFSYVSESNLKSEIDLISYSGKITKVCNQDNLSFYEMDHSNRLYLLHIGYQNSSSLLYSLLPGAVIHLLNFHMRLCADGTSADFFPCCNSNIVIVAFAPPSHGLMSHLKLSKSMVNVNFHDMILFNNVLDKFAMLKKTFLSLIDNNAKEFNIWRDNQEYMLPYFTNPRNLRTIMSSLGWTELKPSKMELLDHSKCQIATVRQKYPDFCNLDRLIAKALSNAGHNIGIYEFLITDTLFCFFEMHSVGFGHLRDDSGRLLIIVKSKSSDSLFKFYSKPDIILITKAVLIVEKYTSKIEPFIYLLVETEDIISLTHQRFQAINQMDEVNRPLLFLPTFKRPIRVAFDRHGVKHLQGNLSGFLRFPMRKELVPIYIRFTGSNLSTFHACHLYQTYAIKIPSQFMYSSSREILVKWGIGCSINVSLNSIEYILPPMTSISQIIESPLYYCSESSIISLVNFYNLTIISKRIECLRVFPSNSVLLPELTHQHDTILCLSSKSSQKSLKVYVVGSNIPLLGIVPGHSISLFGIKVEMRMGEVVGVAGAGSMIIPTEYLPEQSLSDLKSAENLKPLMKIRHLKNLFPSLCKRNFPIQSWISVFPLKVFDLNLDLYCSICSKSRYSMTCEFCASKCRLTGTCTVLVHDSSLEFFIAIEGSESILQLLDLEASEQRIIEYLTVRQESLKIYGNIQASNGIDFASRDDVDWIEEHCVMGCWKRRINIQIVSIPAYLLETPVFGNEGAPAMFTNPSLLKVCSIKNLSGANFLTISPKWIKVKVGCIRECDPIQEAFELMSEFSTSFNLPNIKYEMLAEQPFIAESLTSIPVEGDGGNININESGTATPALEGGIGDKEHENSAIAEQLSASKEILLVIEQQEKRFQMQEETRKEKIRQSLLDKSKVSPSYYKNNPKEYIVLKYIENFNRQYLQLYSGRKELGLIRNNEFGIPKFVSSTIRPTQLPFKQLYDFRSCASFVADFIQYQPLDPPYELPKVLPSPTYTIAMQSGNSFDMATLLVSLLIGVGYDAYVVSGYAAKHITSMDQTHTTAEELKNYLPSSFATKPIYVPRKEEKSSTSKYKVKPPKSLKSGFLLKQEERLKHLQLQQEKRAKDAEMDPPSSESTDEYKGLRVHAWVLIAPGKREVAECFFIEPTTGKIVSCHDEGYLGLESVWSASNFWVNMQICYDGLKGISFDLGDTMKWEFVLLDNNQPNGKKKEIDAEEDDDDKDNLSVVVDMPPSWVDRLVITSEQFESKCPSGGKAVFYKNAKSEVFAEYHRNDGMVRRISFNQKDGTFPNTLVETFANRKDKLFQRVRVDNLIQEYFHPGRSHGLKEHIIRNGITAEMNFYGPARPDGLIKRTEEHRKIIFYFEDREDNLVYKSITYEVIQGENGQQTRGGMIKMAEKFLSDPSLKDNNVAKKTYFLKDDRIRIVFHLGEGKIVPSIREFRKPPPDQKVQSLDLIQNFTACPEEKPMKQQHMYLQLLDLIRAEQNFLQTVKNYDRELSELLQLRVTEEQELSLSISIYDTLRNESKIQANDHTSTENLHKNVPEVEETSNPSNPKSTELDYLSPFLMNIEISRVLSKEDATAVKDACLKSLRERLVEKANIIQGRLDETTNGFQQRQLAYSKNADSMTVEETEEYVKFCNDALFKIHILEKRLAKHKENAPDRYIELDAKLRADPRLVLAFGASS